MIVKRFAKFFFLQRDSNPADLSHTAVQRPNQLSYENRNKKNLSFYVGPSPYGFILEPK